MSRTLYVGNLPLSATGDALASKFAICGTVVSIKFPPLPATRPTNGVALVEMDSPVAAQDAIKRFHRSHYDGRVISVNRVRAAAAPPLPGVLPRPRP